MTRVRLPDAARLLAKLAAALPALALLTLPVLVASCGSGSSSPPRASPVSETTAAKLAATMNDALRAAHSLTGTGVARLTTALGTQVCDFSVAATDHGDYRLAVHWRSGGGSSTDAPSHTVLLVYNASAHTLMTSSTGGLRSVRTGVPGFAVFSGHAQDLRGLALFDPQFAASARAALAAQGTAPIAGSRSGGRPVWDTTVAIPWPSSPTGRVLTSVRLLVDQTTGLTRAMTLAFADGAAARIRYTDLAVDAVIRPGAFDTTGGLTATGNGTPPVTTTDGAPLRLLTLDEARAASGLDPLLPTFRLSGFTLSDVAVAPSGGRDSSERTTDLWLVYRGGLESYQLRLQRAPLGVAPDWRLFAGLAIRDLDHGPFDGEPARTWVRGVPQGTLELVGPGLFVENGQEVARFSGDLLPYEFWQVANSLKSPRT